MPNVDPHEGSCLCGLVKLHIQQLNRDVVMCHCQQCRKQTGHMVAATSALNEHLQIEGAEHITWYAASDIAKRGFCKHCGSVLMWRPNDGNYTAIMAGCVESPSGLTVKGHIYVADKGDYYSIDDGLPQHQQSD